MPTVPPLTYGPRPVPPVPIHPNPSGTRPLTLWEASAIATYHRSRVRPLGQPDGRHRLHPGDAVTLVSHNVNQANPDPEGTVRSLLTARADVLALEELSPATAPAYEQALAEAYPYHFYQGTVGLWSVHPLSDARAVPIMPWTRAMRATVDAPGGPLALYVAHLPSVRVGPRGFTAGARDEALGLLVAEVRAEPVRRVVVLGDLNGSTDDRALRPLTNRLVSAQAEAGAGFGFTWPARLPVVRIDQILLGDVRAASAWTLPATASDHLPVAARIHLSPDPAP
ncbi:endonuclease/exonuclease/phosphatase family protein [Streptomyces sp. NPDC057540]|uniref:endonuclease/exonuclease/phosphatase family protein n=1 Tax=Streptomyces sp. NPDC057540 TaxID=3346160 RepID=UPI0036ADE9A2